MKEDVRYGKDLSLLLRHIRFYQHFAELFELLWAPHFLRQQWELDDVEEVVIKFVRLVQVFLLHVVPYAAVLAIGS